MQLVGVNVVVHRSSEYKSAKTFGKTPCQNPFLLGLIFLKKCCFVSVDNYVSETHSSQYSGAFFKA